MEIITELQQQYSDFIISLYREGILGHQFLEIQSMQKKNEPDLTTDLVNMFFEISEKRLHQLAKKLREQNVNYENVYVLVRQFRGSSLSIGFQRLANSCEAFTFYYNVANLKGCLRWLGQLQNDYYYLKRKLQMLLGLEQQIVAAGGTVPISEFPRQKMKRMLNPKCHRVYGC